MKYDINGTTMQVANIELTGKEAVISEAGSMSWMSANMEMETRGTGIGKMVSRVLAGESLFLNRFHPTAGSGVISFAASAPGKIIPIQLAEGQSIICQKDSFLCAEETVDVKIHFRMKLGRGFFGGEGFIMEEISGPGLVFVEVDGEVIEYNLAENQELKVDNGYIAYYEPTVNYDVQMVKGVKNMVFGGEGLFMATVKGPGKVVLQTMPIAKLAGKIMRYMPYRG